MQTALVPERKKRGLFSATVYTAALEMTGSFAVPSAPSLEKLVGRGAMGSARVVRTALPRRTPCRRCWRISRSTVQRATATPSRLS